MQTNKAENLKNFLHREMPPGDLTEKKAALLAKTG